MLEIPSVDTRATLKLVTTGRRSLLPHVVEVRFVTSQKGFYVLGAGPRSDWVLNTLAAGRVKVRMGEICFPCNARRATKEEANATMDLFQAKYGKGIVGRWYARSTECIFLEISGRPERRGAVFGESAATLDFQGWKSGNRDYYSDVATAFDSASEEYDFTISHNFINTWIRRRTLALLNKYLDKDDVALEIGCGTGVETLQIAKRVRKVVATDISEGMISLLMAKKRAMKVANILPIKLGAAEISQAAPYLDNGKATIAYSLNGALNCEPRLDSFVAGLSDLLAKESHFICSVRNILSLSEVAIHTLLLQFGRATPRVKQPTMVSVGGIDIPSTYYSPSTFTRRFEPFFRVKEIVALPVLLPPAYLSQYYVKLRPILSPLESLEKALAGRLPFNRLGDQTLIVFQKSV
jgi:deazaflavin-dependent oxidoreductase (nitroreductase family)